MKLLYQIKGTIIDLNLCREFKKADIMSPFKKEDDDNWQDVKGNFKIIIDEEEFSYETLQERDVVFNDIMNKMTCSFSDNGSMCVAYGGAVFSDKQVLAAIPY